VDADVDVEAIGLDSRPPGVTIVAPTAVERAEGGIDE
jgi:hypothetical protein